MKKRYRLEQIKKIKVTYNIPFYFHKSKKGLKKLIEFGELLNKEIHQHYSDDPDYSLNIEVLKAFLRYRTYYTRTKKYLTSKDRVYLEFVLYKDNTFKIKCPMLSKFKTFEKLFLDGKIELPLEIFCLIIQFAVSD
jgi:hypothetical protein